MTYDIDHTLRTLDPARHASTGLSDRAIEDLNRIMASPRQEPPDITSTPRRSSSWRRPTRLLPVAAAVAGLSVLGGSLRGGDDSAYATWTAQPAAVAVDDQVAYGQNCQAFWDGSPVGAAGLTPILAERRGDWSYTLMVADDGRTADCLLLDPSGAGGDPWSEGSGGLGPVTSETPASSAVKALAHNSTGLVGGAYVAVNGQVGKDVTSIVLNTPTAGDVETTVSNGYWAAWWPVSRSELDDQGGLTLTATMTDGSTQNLAFDDIQVVPADEQD